MSKYIDSYAKFLNGKLDVRRKLKIVIDCSNGTTGLVAGKLKVESGKLMIILINDRPDGNFPAHGPNPLIAGATAELEARVRKDKADLGVIFDADGDRVFFIDELGRSLDAHEAGYILAQVSKPPFVVSEIASWRLKRIKGAAVSPVGHYFFKNLMRKKEASLGLEHSGHFYFKDFFYCDSGILAAIKVINFVSALDGGISKWIGGLPGYFRSGEVNFKIRDKKKILAKLEKIYGKKADRISRLDGITMEFYPPAGGDHWFNVRASNTENLLRLNVEATDGETLKKKTAEISRLISGRRG